MQLDENKMSEAEVSLRLALFLISHGFIKDKVEVAIDGAQIQVSEEVYFPINDFLSQYGCIKVDLDPSWRGIYKIGKYKLIIHSTPGKGDVVAQLVNGQTLFIESKKGTLIKSKSSSEYPLLREAIGQLVTNENVGDNYILAVAVPFSSKFAELIGRWTDVPIIRKIGLRFLMVRRDGEVLGLNV